MNAITTTSRVLKALEVLSWIIFIGLCIDAGGLAINTIISLFINPSAVEYFWTARDYLSELSKFGRGHFTTLALIMNIVVILKAVMFYLILVLFRKRGLTIERPFSSVLRDLVFKFSYLALGIGIFSQIGLKYTEWLVGQGMPAANMEALKIAGADVWLFMAVLLFVIGQMVKRGMEIQVENDLTI